MRGTAGETTFCTGEDPRESKEKKKEGLRKKDREAPRPNLLLHTFAESWICHAAAAVHYLLQGEKKPPAAAVSLRQPLATDTLGR